MTKRILILDDDRDFARTIAARCTSLAPDIMADVAFSSVDATTKVNLDKPDLICLDIDLSHENGLGFCEYLAWNLDFANIPVIMMTRREDHEAIRRSCVLELHFVDKSVDCWDELQTTIHLILGLGDVATQPASTTTEHNRPTARPLPLPGVTPGDPRFSEPFQSL